MKETDKNTINKTGIRCYSFYFLGFKSRDSRDSTITICSVKATAAIRHHHLISAMKLGSLTQNHNCAYCFPDK